MEQDQRPRTVQEVIAAQSEEIRILNLKLEDALVLEKSHCGLNLKLIASNHALIASREKVITVECIKLRNRLEGEHAKEREEWMAEKQKLQRWLVKTADAHHEVKKSAGRLQRQLQFQNIQMAEAEFLFSALEVGFTQLEQKLELQSSSSSTKKIKLDDDFESCGQCETSVQHLNNNLDGAAESSERTVEEHLVNRHVATQPQEVTFERLEEKKKIAILIIDKYFILPWKEFLQYAMTTMGQGRPTFENWCVGECWQKSGKVRQSKMSSQIRRSWLKREQNYMAETIPEVKRLYCDGCYKKLANSLMILEMIEAYYKK